MPLAFLLDEHLRGGPLWHAIQQHNSAGSDVMDAVRVGDFPDLGLQATDPEVLAWAEGASRILISMDKRSLANHLAAHLQRGHSSPGVLLIRRGSSLRQIIGFLVLVAHYSDAKDWENRLEFIP